MNVGDPDCSHRDGSISYSKYKSEGAEIAVRKSDGS